MKKVLRLLCAACICVCALSSCDNENDNPTITQQVFPNFFASVTNMAEGVGAVYSNISYGVILNYTDMTADVQINGLRLPDGTSYPAMTLSQIPWTIDKSGWKVIKGSNLTPSVSGISPVFNNFEFRIYERILDSEVPNVYSPGVFASFSIDSKYRVISTMSTQTLYGETESTSASGKEFDTHAIEYVVSFNTETRMLNITMNNARFEQDMPMNLNIELRNIPVTFTNSGMNFDVDAIIPSIGGTPFAAFPISNLRGYYNPGEGLEFSFRCDPRTTTESYNVEVDCDFSMSRPSL